MSFSHEKSGTRSHPDTGRHLTARRADDLLPDDPAVPWHQELVWCPGKGVNVILGGGDVGKTTVLDAIGLLFSPTSASNISDTD